MTQNPDPQIGLSAAGAGLAQVPGKVAGALRSIAVYWRFWTVVLGTFVQFYMRAGVFTDGGKKERERAEARSRAKARAAGQDITEPASEKPVKPELL